MRDLYPQNWKAKLSRFLLDLDSRIDFAIFQGGRNSREYFERFVIFMDRFSVSGIKRLFVEAASEGLTLGAGGLVVLLALAIPAFNETSDKDWLKKSELAVTFLDRYGNEVGSRGIKHNDAIPLDEFPDHLIKAVLATEDRRFHEHFGIDFAGTLRALAANTRAGGVVQGGSSITQQLAKNLFLSNERTIERKVNEAFLALWLETRLTKNEILKLYLDRAYMGGGAFGVDAAAQYYFGKSARDVNLAEAAMLAGLFKAPTKFAPHVNLPAARARANVVLDNLVEAGFMTEGQVFGARRNPATAIDRRDERVPSYYLDWAFDAVKKTVAKLPPSVSERVFVVRTALDVNLQREAENAIENSLRQYGREYHAKQAATVLMDLDGSVRAMVGGRDYGTSQFNRATDALRQPGSSFKPYVYATALANGFKPTTIVVDSPVCIGNWCPHNYSNRYSGRMTLTQALTRSINVIPVKLSIALGNGNAKAGRKKIIATARAAGLRTPLPDSTSLPIGAAEVTVLDQTGGYTMFPNGGKSSTPHAVLEMRTGAGDVVWRFDRDGPKPRQAITPEVASEMSMMMNKVVEEGTGRRAMLDGIRAGGKTGTTNAYRDAWFVGFTGNYVCGVWFGNDDYSPTNRMTGGSLPAQTWHQIMAYAHQGIDLKQIPGVPPPDSRTRAVVQAAAPTASGDAPPPAPVRPTMLTKRSIDVLLRVEHLLDETARSIKPASNTPPAGAASAAPPMTAEEALAAAAEATSGSVRRN
ncbi:MAG: PBP1A family penicillin-binding protein [Rhizobiales bacterium]|nr:PBP1A family penicillin-binding protein [Hyphomicrobiales bacterium]